MGRSQPFVCGDQTPRDRASVNSMWCSIQGVLISGFAKISSSGSNPPKENLIAAHLYSMVFKYVYRDKTAPEKANQFGVAFMQLGEKTSNIDRNIMLHRNKWSSF